jgi:hypothetical protein
MECQKAFLEGRDLKSFFSWNGGPGRRRVGWGLGWAGLVVDWYREGVSINGGWAEVHDRKAQRGTGQLGVDAMCKRLVMHDKHRESRTAGR